MSFSHHKITYWLNLLDEIKSKEGDFEAQHSLEDDMYRKFVEMVASGELQNLFLLEAIAQVVLTTKELDFERYCA